jgi:hypothetical protein
MAKLTKVQQAELDGLKATLKATKKDLKTANKTLGTTLGELKTTQNNLTLAKKTESKEMIELRAALFAAQKTETAALFELGLHIVTVDEQKKQLFETNTTVRYLGQKLEDAEDRAAQWKYTNGKTAVARDEARAIADSNYNSSAAADAQASALAVQIVALNTQIATDWLNNNPGATTDSADYPFK